MKKLTVETIKAMHTDKVMVALAKNLFTAMAYEQTIADLVKPKQQEVVSFYKFQVAEENKKFGRETISNKDHMYLASEEDFTIYMNEMHKFYIANGFKVELGVCPLLQAESLTRTAEQAFVNASQQYTGLNVHNLICAGMKHYREYIELNLKMFASKDFLTSK